MNNLIFIVLIFKFQYKDSKVHYPFNGKNGEVDKMGDEVDFTMNNNVFKAKTIIIEIHCTLFRKKNQFGFLLSLL